MINSVASHTPNGIKNHASPQKRAIFNTAFNAFPASPTNAPIQPSSSSQTIVGNAGTLKVWGSGHYLNWSIVMTVPVTHFIGTVSSTDITSGLSAGTSGVTGFSGKCYCARISGHTYVAHLDGVAYLGTVAVAKTGFNTVSWRP